MIGSESLRRRAIPIDRSTDRLVALSAIGIAIAFLGAAALAALLPPADRRDAWLPLHLAMAGGATTAIAGVMPFFSAAFAAAPPSDARLRLAAIFLCAGGAIGVTIGVVTGEAAVGMVAGLGFIGGIVLTGLATIRPVGNALGPSRGIILQGYLLALINVGIGAGLATLLEAGWTPIVTIWASAKPAHAWLNLVGFVSLVVATTLLHFFPTIIGARIATRASARWTIRGLAAGAPLVAFGLLITSDLLTLMGAVLVACGAFGLGRYAWAVWQTRAHWTTDRAWHRFVTVTMISAIIWFEIGIAVGLGRIAIVGASLASWSLDAVVAPLVIGWISFALVASATHLVPAVGPGDQTAHARQRALLGRLAVPRLIVANAGVAALAIALPLQLDGLTGAGVLAVGAALAVSAVLIAGALAVPLMPSVRSPARSADQ